MAKKFLEADEFGWAASVLEDWADVVEENDDKESTKDIRILGKKLRTNPDNLSTSEWKDILMYLHQELSE